VKAYLYLYDKYEKLTLTLPEVCQELSLAVGTAHNMISMKKFPIPTRKVGRNLIADIRDLGEYFDRERQQAREAFAKR